MIQKDKAKLELQELVLEYDSSLLNRWRNRDISIVPAHLLEHKGPGIENGYGFGEWYVESYYRQMGYEVMRDYNIISKISKFKQNNAVIADLVGSENLLRFGQHARGLYEKGQRIENIDLFVYGQNKYFFVEVKKGKDKLREPQQTFIHLVKKLLDVDSVVIYLKEVIAKGERE